MTDRSDLVGKTGVPYRFVVEEGKVGEFAKAVHAVDPLFHDADAAADAGLAGVLAPPSFVAASAHWAVPGAMPDLQLDLRGVLAGGSEWEYLSPVCVGDVLTVTSSVESVTRKEGGSRPMTIIALRTDFTRDDELVQIYRSTVLQFDVPKEGGR